MRILRLMLTGWVFTMKTNLRSGFMILTAVIQPVIFASIAFFMFQAGQRSGTLLYAAIGAGLMGIWSTTLFSSGGSLQWWRWQGFLEPLVASPAPFALVLLPATLANATYGMYALGMTLAWGKLAFGIPLTFAHPWLFAVAVPATILSLGLLGFFLASSFVLYRHANALSNMLEYPVWLVTGVLVPLSLLPGWVRPIGWLLAPTWGVRAIRDSALGGDPLPAIGMTLGLGAVYLALGAIFLTYFMRLARERATLSLT